MAPTTGSYMQSSSIEAQIWSRVSAEIPSLPDSPFLWNSDAGTLAASAVDQLRGHDCAWGDLAGVLPQHALTAGSIASGKHRSPWCALCQMPVSRCIEGGCDLRLLRTPSPGHRRSPSIASRAPSRNRGPSRLGAASRASVNDSSAVAGLEESTPGFGSSLGSRALPFGGLTAPATSVWSKIKPYAEGDPHICRSRSYVVGEFQERPMSPYAEGLPSAAPARLPPAKRSSVSSVRRSTPSRTLHTPWEEDDLRNIRMCRSNFAKPVLLRVDRELEERDNDRRKLNAEIERQERKEKLKILAEQQRGWRDREQLKVARRRHKIAEKEPEVEKKVAVDVSLDDESPKAEGGSSDSDGEMPVMQRASSWNKSRKTLRMICTKKIQMNLRNDMNLAFHGGTTKDGDEQKQAPVLSRAETMHELASNALGLNREGDGEKQLKEAFIRYDTDRSGCLCLQEIRAVLEDVGLMPRTPQEKSSARRAFAESVITSQHDDDETAHLLSLLNGEDADRLDPEECRQHRSFEEKMARRLAVRLSELPSLLEKIRIKFQESRKKVLQEHCNRREIFENGELDFASVKAILLDLDLYPSTEEEEARLKSLIRAMPSNSPEASPKGSPRGKLGVWGLVQDLRAEAGNQSSRSSKESPEFLRVPRTSKAPANPKPAATPERVASPEDKNEDELNRTLPSLGFQEFEILVEFLSEAREQQRAKEGVKLAEDLGLISSSPRSSRFGGLSSERSATLFLEFRKELGHLHALFCRFDEDWSGYLDLSEIWEALIALGLMPKQHEDKVAVMDIVKTLSATYVPRSSSREGAAIKNQGGISYALTWLYRPGSTFEHCMCSVAYQNNTYQTSNEASDSFCIEFLGFLELIRQIRSWSQASMREELRPLFEKLLRTKGVVVSEVLRIPEVCKALEELAMAPTNLEEQKEIQQLFEDSNEWGFDPPTFDFETFVRLIRQVREWMHSRNREKERDYAARHLGFQEKQVNQYRMAFDILDEGTEKLTIMDVRKVFRLLNRNISSDHLRELFTRMDLSGSGEIGFVEFLHLVYELDADVIMEANNKAAEEEARRLQEEREQDKYKDNDLIYRVNEAVRPSSSMSRRVGTIIEE